MYVLDHPNAAPAVESERDRLPDIRFGSKDRNVKTLGYLHLGNSFRRLEERGIARAVLFGMFLGACRGEGDREND